MTARHPTPTAPSAASLLQVDGLDVHVEGEGEHALVMLHGWPDTYRLWDGQSAFFKSDYRCVRFTLPGFDVAQPRRAYSLDATLDHIHRVVEAVSPGRPVVLMLHDWGCLFGYQYAMRHPGRVSRIVGVDIGDAGSRSHTRSLSLKAKLMAAGYQLWLAAAWRIGGALGDRMTLGMTRALKVPADPRFISAKANFPYDIAWTGSHGSYKQVRPFEPPCPLLFVYGTRKPFLFHSPAWAEAQASKPGNRVVALQAGHWVMKDQPREFNDAVSDWLAAGAASA